MINVYLSILKSSILNAENILNLGVAAANSTRKKRIKNKKCQVEIGILIERQHLKYRPKTCSFPQLPSNHSILEI